MTNLNEIDLIEFNDGFLPPEKDYKPTDWVLGSISGIAYEERLKNGNWRQYRSKYEDQKHGGIDKMACVSESYTNSVEAQINWMIDNGIIINDVKYSINIEKIKDWMENGKFECSQRQLAADSNTTFSGNTQPKVAETARKNGLAPERMWPTLSANQYMSWTEYYKPRTNEVKLKAKELLNYFSFNYERLPNSDPEVLKHQIKQCPIWWATATCPGWGTKDIIPMCLISPNHATIGDCYDNLLWWGDLDHYKPYEKKLAWNYKIYYPYKVVVTPLKEVLKRETSMEDQLMKLYKVKEKPEIYFLGLGDNLYHHIINEPVFKGLFGDFANIEIIELEYIEPEKIGFTIYDKKSFLDVVINLFANLKGRK